MESLCLRFGMRTVTRALSTASDECAGKELVVASSAQDLMVLTDVASGVSASSSTRSAANRTLFNARPVRATPTRLAAARRRVFPSSVFLSSRSTRIRHSSVWPCARPPMTSALQPGQRPDVSCARKSLCLRYSLLGIGSRFGSGGRVSTDASPFVVQRD